MHRIPLLIGLIFLVLAQPLYCQQSSESGPASRIQVDVDASSHTKELQFKVDGNRIPNNDLVDFLNRNGGKYKSDAVPYVVVPASLSIYDITSIRATFDMAGYHSARFFLYAKDIDSFVEIVFKDPIPAERIRGKASDR